MQTKRSLLGEKKESSVELGLQHEWHFKNILYSCRSTLKSFEDKGNNNFKVSILKKINEYLMKGGKKIPYYRLKNVTEILKLLKQNISDEILKSKLEDYIYDKAKFTTGRLPISDLRHAMYGCIQKFDFNNNEIYFKNRKAAPTA